MNEYIVSNCEMCGTPLAGSNVVYDTELNKTYCRKCTPYIRTCYNCHNGDLCDFKTNPSPLPMQVQATQRVGNTVMSQVITNPERVKITCENGCPCYSAEFGCGKEFCVQNRFCLNKKWSEK